MFNWIEAVALVVLFVAFACLYIWGIVMMRGDSKTMLNRAERSGIKTTPHDLQNAVNH